MAGNDNANFHQNFGADPIQIIAKCKSSTSINAKAIKVIKPDLGPPSNERNKNSEKDVENELAVVVYEEGNNDAVDNISRDKFFEKESNEGNNSLEKDNRAKMNMEEQNIMEEDAIRRKLDHKLYSIQDYNHLKSDIETYNAQKEDDRDMGSITDPGILDMIKTITESREKYPLPNSFRSRGSTRGNCMLRFDDIGPITNGSILLFIPRGLRQFVVGKEVHSQVSKCYGFVQFSCPEIALCFMNKFNKLKIPGTSLTYNLSWAPFKRKCSAVKQIDESKGNQFNVPTENTEKDNQVGVLKALEMKTRDEVDEIAIGLEKLFSELDDQAHSVTDDPSFCIPRKKIKFSSRCWDDGVTQTLFLRELDPVIKQDHIMRVFEKYGKCSVYLPPGGGWGTVTFNERSFAESAYDALSTVLRNSGICGLNWSFERKRSKHPEDEWIQWTGPRHCYMFGQSCPKGQKSVS